jgi:hypothetical protein
VAGEWFSGFARSVAREVRWSSREYDYLVNGFIVCNDTGEEQVEIPCDTFGAELIMTFAARACP